MIESILHIVINLAVVGATLFFALFALQVAIPLLMLAISVIMIPVAFLIDLFNRGE